MKEVTTGLGRAYADARAQLRKSTKFRKVVKFLNSLLEEPKGERRKMKLTRTMKIGIGGLSLFVFGVSFGWMLFPMVLKSQVHKVSVFTKERLFSGALRVFVMYFHFKG